MIDLIPVVMENLSTESLDKQVLTFFRLVKEAKFPLKNIAFQLWLEVVKWFDCENSTEMRYCESSKKFWKLGYRLFGGQFLHFMSGYKNKNSVVLQDTEKGIYPPSQSEINFAVPSKDILTAFSPYGIDKCLDGVLGRPPGILTDMVETLAKSPSVNSYCLTFDGKKLKRGLTKSSGDVDLLGFEPGISLAERIKQTESIRQPIEKLLRLYSGKDEMVIMGTDLENSERQKLSCMLADQLKKVSLDIHSVRDLRKKKIYAKEKLMDRSGGTDWKNGKYVLAISCLIAFIHDIDEYLKESIMLVDELSLCICSLRLSLSAINQSVLNLDTCSSYVQIEKADNMSETRKIKQRTPEWFARRSKALVTGSTIYSAVGLDGLAKQKEHFDLVVGGLPEKEKPEKVMKAMNHGTLNEINAVATMVGKVLPMLCPGQRMYEEGFVEMTAAKSGRPFMVVSPDGSVSLSEAVESTSVAIELKCPIFDIQHNFPKRYLLQCLSEMEALDVDTLLYLCWRPDLSTVFKVNRNKYLLNKAFNLAKSLYDIDKPKRPTKLTPEAKSLKEDINNACENNTTVEFVGVFQSIKHDAGAKNIYESGKYPLCRFLLCLNQLLSNHDRYYELQRIPATEAIVFLCCDLDRNWGRDTVHSIPVCWFPKGSSLDTATMRNIFESVLNSCKSAGLHIPAASFDGQWHNIAVRDVNDKPLTTLQLQKDFWKQVERMSKQEILKSVQNMNKVVKHSFHTSLTDDASVNRVIICTNGGLRLPRLSESIVRERQKGNRHITTYYQANVHEVAERELSYPIDDQLNENKIQSSQVNSAIVDIDDFDQYKHTDIYTDGADIDTDGLSNAKTHINLSDNDMDALLNQFKLDKMCNAKKQWDNKSMEDKLAFFTSGASLRKLRDVELRILVRYINRSRKTEMKESDKKEVKIEKICKLINIEYSIVQRQKTTSLSLVKVYNPKRLSEMAFKRVSSSLKKSDLNIIYAEYLWPEVFQKWNLEHSNSVKLQNEETQFYYPAYSEARKQLEVSCVNSSHLLTRMRRKSAKGGLDGVGNEAWRKVAKSNKTPLSLGMVDCILEPMAVSVANTHFSEAVELEMRVNGDIKEADLCRDIRSWWRAEDEAGIPTEKRVELRSLLKDRIMKCADLTKFPPPGMFINGWPTQLWEATIANIDAKSVLYTLTPGNKYNVRAFSSMMGETFFSELTLYDRRGQGTVTSMEFGQYIDTTIEKLHIRLDPKRNFSYNTSRKKVYKLVGQYDAKQEDDTDEYNDVDIEKLCTMRDHEFDDPERLRSKPKTKVATIEQSRNAVARGSLGVRWENARRNESKLLPTYRLGLDLDEVS